MDRLIVDSGEPVEIALKFDTDGELCISMGQGGLQVTTYLSRDRAKLVVDIITEALLSDNDV